MTPLVTYLASPAAMRINGEVFVVHGGVAAVARFLEELADGGGHIVSVSREDATLRGKFVYNEADARVRRECEQSARSRAPLS